MTGALGNRLAVGAVTTRERMGEALVWLGPAAELTRRKRTVVTTGGLDLLVLHVRRRFTVLDNHCPHLGSPLDDARIVGRTHACAAHGFKYALGDGAHIPSWRCPAGQAGRLRLLPTRVEDGWLVAVIDPALAARGP